MKKQVVISGPVNGQLVVGYKDEGPSHAVPHRNLIGGRVPGTKSPGTNPPKERQ